MGKKARKQESEKAPCSAIRYTLYAIRSRSGFTLIEMLATIGILALLSGLVIGYTRGGSAQINILKDKSVFYGALSRARALAVQTYQYNPPECGYGIHIFADEIPPRRYVLWRDTAGNGSCNDSNSALRANGAYDSTKDSNGDGVPDENFEFFELEPTLAFLNMDDAALRDILFIPPEPAVMRNENPGSVDMLRVTIGTIDGETSASFSVGPFGQVEE